MITREDRISAIANAIAEGLTESQARMKAIAAVDADPLTAKADRLLRLNIDADTIKEKLCDLYEYMC